MQTIHRRAKLIFGFTTPHMYIDEQRNERSASIKVAGEGECVRSPNSFPVDLERKTNWMTYEEEEFIYYGVSVILLSTRTRAKSVKIGRMIQASK
jgi:hypothetical protein